MVILFMPFVWDPAKAAANLQKHRVSFEEASTVFADPYVDLDEDTARGERRFIAIGYSNRNRVLFVVACELDGDTVRIISARRATPYERSLYEGNNEDHR